MHSTRLLRGALAFALVMFLGGGALGCGPKPAGKLPVAGPLVNFTAPEVEDLIPEPETDDGDGGSGGDEE